MRLLRHPLIRASPRCTVLSLLLTENAARNTLLIARVRMPVMERCTDIARVSNLPDFPRVRIVIAREIRGSHGIVCAKLMRVGRALGVLSSGTHGSRGIETEMGSWWLRS